MTTRAEDRVDMTARPNCQKRDKFISVHRIEPASIVKVYRPVTEAFNEEDVFRQPNRRNFHLENGTPIGSSVQSGGVDFGTDADRTCDKWCLFVSNFLQHEHAQRLLDLFVASQTWSSTTQL
ncbi:unnamed protein product [Protopolystoma xenopodis]|uniref:Uncharacterized protein n=1 Tax=Protopolystoma xenopodis TaxID=117903 RepID=A0A3S5BHH1_9PLAT|nr:unnamed protein product [Protopolystoma xenopodis]